MTHTSIPPIHDKQRTAGVCSAILLLAMSLTIGGFYLPWFSFRSDDMSKHLSPASVGVNFNVLLSLWVRPLSLSLITIALLSMFLLFGVALLLILVPEFVRMLIKKVVQSPARLGLSVWRGCLIVVDISLFEFMWLVLGFDDSDTNATNFHYDIGVLCTLISLVLSIGAAYCAERISDAMTHHASNQ